MSLETKAKALAEKAKVAAGNATEKAKVVAEDVSQKVKEIDVDKVKSDIKEDAGKVSVESIRALSTKTKAIAGGVLLLIIILLSGGGRSYSVSNFSEPFPTNGTLKERCEKFVFFRYDYVNLVKDGVDSDELIAALDVAINAVDKASFKALPQMEQQYYQALYELKSKVVSSKGKQSKAFKEKHFALDRYEAALERCVAMNGVGSL